MSAQSVPNCCIWCHGKGPDVSFDKSHVVPECVGNEEQVLPPGVVCKKCNQYFGSKIEPVLLDDPLFHVIAVVLGLVDREDMNAFRDRVFDDAHAPDAPVERTLNLHAQVSELELGVDVKYTIQGRHTRQYSLRQLQFLSRAIHKIAFESLAYEVFVRGVDEPIDLFSAYFNPVRDWVREGRPSSSVRPVVRKPASTVGPIWAGRFWRFPQGLGVELMLFGDWYAVTLTSKQSEALTHLQAWMAGRQTENVWCITERFRPLANLQ